jgi:hypothetical protein
VSREGCRTLVLTVLLTLLVAVGLFGGVLYFAATMRP